MLHRLLAWRSPAPKPFWSYLAAALVVGVCAALAEALYQSFDTTRVSVIFLAGVLVVAVRLGSGPAYFAAILAFFGYNFFLTDPRYELAFEPEDTIVLAAFLSVAMLTGGLAGRVRDEALRAEERAQVSGALLQATREFSSASDPESIRRGLARHVARASRGSAIVIDGADAWMHPPGAAWPDPLVAELRALAGGAQGGEPITFEFGFWRARQLLADGGQLGVVGWRPADGARAGPEEEGLINVLIDLGAAAVSRALLATATAEMEALARTERLRAALLSSISHDLRTPLAAILASATSLRDFGGRFEPAVRDDLLLTIQEEAERLNAFVANLLQMTKLESGALTAEAVAFDAGEVVGRMAERFGRRRGARRLVLRPDPSGALAVRGDPLLLEQALSNVVENAIRYSPDGSTVAVTAASGRRTVTLEVTDEGPGVPPADLPRIFEKFFRSPESAGNSQGTGLGLSITKGLVEAMGGAVNARRGDGGRGLTVSITLPVAT